MPHGILSTHRSGPRNPGVASAAQRAQAQESQAETKPLDQLFWVFLRRVWSRWPEVLVVVKPETVVRWHRAGFRLIGVFFPGGKETGRPGISSELRQLLERMAAMAKENPPGELPEYMESS